MRFLGGSLLLLISFALMSVRTAQTYSSGLPLAPATPTPPRQAFVTNPTFTPAPIDISDLTGPPQRLTRAGCCPYAGWSFDSEWILYLDGKADETSPGLYNIPRSGGAPSQLTTRFGTFSADWSWVAYQEAGQVFVERWVDRARWPVPSNGRAVSFSLDLELLAWEYGSTSIQSPDRRQTQVWISALHGDGARELVTIHGGDFVGWVDGSQAILVTGRLAPPDPAGIWKIDTATGAGRLLFKAEEARNILVSPSGDWVAFVIAFESDPSRNGIWVIKTDGSYAEKLPVFGAYRWRSDGQLLLIPLDLDLPNPDLYQIDLENTVVWKLIDPDLTQLTIANNDWSISPNGRWLLFLSAEDRNLWTIELPDPPESP
jgi:hypothetical protein